MNTITHTNNPPPTPPPMIRLLKRHMTQTPRRLHQIPQGHFFRKMKVFILFYYLLHFLGCEFWD